MLSEELQMDYEKELTILRSKLEVHESRLKEVFGELPFHIKNAYELIEAGHPANNAVPLGEIK